MSDGQALLVIYLVSAVVAVLIQQTIFKSGRGGGSPLITETNDHSMGDPLTPDKDRPYLKLLQRALMENGRPAQLARGFLLLPDLALKIALEVTVFREDEKFTLLDFRFYFYGGLIDDALFVNLTGWGEDKDAATGQALSKAQPLIAAVADSLMGVYLPQFNLETTWGDRKLKWHCLPSDLHIMGQTPEEPFEADTYPALVLPALSEYLGNKGFYLVKIYAQKSIENEIPSECRLDWRLIPEASRLVHDYAQKWEVDTFRFDTQYIVIRQCRSDYQPAYDLAGLDTRLRLAISWTMDNPDYELEDSVSILAQIFQNKHLAMEFQAFLAELCLSYVLPDLNFQRGGLPVSGPG